jgi:hypothetical protein
MRPKQCVATEKGGVLYGYWSDSKPIITELYETESTFTSPNCFRFRADKVRKDILIGFWHTHSRFPFHSLTDMFAYRKLVNLFQKKLIFIIFVHYDASIHALLLRPGKLLPTFLTDVVGGSSAVLNLQLNIKHSQSP